MKMLEHFKDGLAGNPDRVLELIQQLLEDFVHREGEKGKRSKPGALGPSLSNLGAVVEHDASQSTHKHSSPIAAETRDDAIEIISVALSVLSVILLSPEFISNSKRTTVLNTLLTPLDYISNPASPTPAALQMAAINAAALISAQTSAPTLSQETAGSNPYSEDRKTYLLAVQYISDSVIPVRAQGLSLLSSLIKARSAILDIPAISVLLLSLLQDEDEYIYLNAIKSLSLLAQNHPRTVVKMLLEQYLDIEEKSGMDQRLRLGEALTRTMDELGEGLDGETAKYVGRGVIHLAGRRARRPKAEAERHDAGVKRKRENEEARKAWGGEVPNFGGEVDEESGSERIADIVEGWEGKDGEEDVRIRTSAFSILGSAIRANVAGLGSTITGEAIDMAVPVLTLELGEEKAILRRAAVLLIDALAKAMSRAQEERQVLGFGFADDNLVEILKVLRYVKATDKDELVRGHTTVIIENLDALRSKNLLGVSSFEGRVTAPEGLLADGRLAGLSINPSKPSSSRVRIEEVD